jgi:hypothetical protein
MVFETADTLKPTAATSKMDVGDKGVHSIPSQAHESKN